jgi:hypothetical protein
VGVSTGIRVDLAALSGLLAELRRDVDQALAPSTRTTAQELGDAAKFGGSSASGEVIAGATDVSYAASIAAYNVDVHVDNANAIANAIGSALAGYAAVDAVAGETFAAHAGALSGTSPPSGADGLTPVFVGPLLAPKLPVQALQPSPHALKWDSFDTPRIWTMVASEVSEAAWAQMHAFRRLSDLLDDQHRRMLALRDRLVTAWTPQGAGAEILAVWDQHATALASDAMCAHLTSKAMEGILETLSDARTKISRLQETWKRITTDFMPEAWDHAAEKTNEKARLVMVEAEKAVADYRRHIAVPRAATALIFERTETIPGGGPKESGSGSGGGESRPAGSSGAQSGNLPVRVGHSANGSAPPPLPGSSPTVDGPSLAGFPQTVGISPSTPPSVLPIPPGANALAPHGGAYVLPGGLGPNGRVLPMPTQTAAGAAARGNMVGRQSVGPGIYGMPGAGVGGRDGGQVSRRQMATEQWEVAVGVPPVIRPPEPPESEDPPPEVDEERERFEEWYRHISMPWTQEEPQRKEGHAG